jgi:thiol:disulfide interchange protein DsbC
MRYFYVATLLMIMAGTLNAAPTVEALEKNWGELLADNPITAVESAPIDGLWEVDAGAQVFYANEKGDKLIFGDILSLDPKMGYVNLTEKRRMGTRMNAIRSLNPEDMITYAAKKPKHDIYVFTDPDCGYCRKFHKERDELLENGISIHYLAMPRTPPGSPSYNKSVSIWCAADRQKALTEAKRDTFKDDEKTCAAGEKIVATDVKLAREFGAQGTPTIILDTGEVVPGYVPAEQIIEYYEDYAKTTTR